MKKLIVLILLFAAAFWVTLQVLEWRREGAGRGGDVGPVEIEAARSTAARIIDDARTSRSTSLSLDETQLRALIVATIADSRWGEKILAGTREVKVALSDTRAEGGLVLSLETVEESLTAQSGSDLDRALKLLRWIPGSDIYVGLGGTPMARRGGIGMAEDDLEVVLGPLSVAARDLEDQLGFKASEVAERVRLSVGELEIISVQPEAGRLRLEIAPAS